MGVDKNLIKNIISLFLIQGANYIIPLISVPILVRAFGLDGFGQYSFVIALIQYVNILVDFGFNLTATRLVSINRDSKEKLSEIFFSVILSKLLLLAATMPVVFVLCITIDKFHSLLNAIIVGYFSVFFSVFFPQWLFQGLEKMPLIAVCNFFSRLFGVLLLVLLVKSKSDIIIALMVLAISAMSSSLISISFIIKMRVVSFDFGLLSWRSIFNQIANSWHVFISTAFVSLYTTSVPIILGMNSLHESVGVYAAADKLKQAIQGIIPPVVQAFYPRLSRKMAIDQSSALHETKLLFMILVASLILVSLLFWALSDYFVGILYGNDKHVISQVFDILVWAVPFVGGAAVIGLMIVLPLGYSNLFSHVYLKSGVFGLLSMIYLSKKYNEFGAGLAALSVEIFVFLCFCKALHKILIERGDK